MDSCDVLIVGGGPAGSSCARRLHQAGLDVVVVDRALFPRDKVCAGWITPQVVADLRLDLDDYCRGRTLQPITGFRIGTIGDDRDVRIVYRTPVSFGIRRCEFDDYLLRQSGARLELGIGISTVRRDERAARWVVDDRMSAPMLVGAGGHFCPIARGLNPDADDDASLVVAQEAEFETDDPAVWMTAPEMPELYFCRDFTGYGWCVRKEQYINVGFGRVGRRSLPRATAEFVAFLKARGRIPRSASWRWRGHAYRLRDAMRRRVDAGVLLVGDAAGLAYPQSGEGIRPAVESGLLAAAAIISAAGQYTRERLASYDAALRRHFGIRTEAGAFPLTLPPSMSAAVGRWLLRRPRLVRHLLLDRCFLHAHQR